MLTNNVLTVGLTITAKNTYHKLKTIVVWIITKGAALLLKLPIASLRFIARVGTVLLDGRNRKVLVILLTTALVVIASRTLVN